MIIRIGMPYMRCVIKQWNEPELSDIYMLEGFYFSLPHSPGMRYNELMDFYRKYRKVW